MILTPKSHDPQGRCGNGKAPFNPWIFKIPHIVSFPIGLEDFPFPLAVLDGQRRPGDGQRLVGAVNGFSVNGRVDLSIIKAIIFSKFFE